MKRKGALTISLHAWHLDVEEFLELKTEQGDERSKARDIFPQLICPDLFMERVDNNLDWTLLDPYEVSQVYGVDIVSLAKKEFEELYLRIERENKLTLSRVVKARDIFKKAMSSWVETGLPYLFFIDNANAVNPNAGEGLIETANLCVVPETKVLTREGYVEIQSLAGQNVDLWNGEEWSNSPVFKTGEDQEILEIEFNNGSILKTTHYHKFPGLKEGTRNNRHTIIRAHELKEGDRLIKFDLPIILGEEEFLYPYTSGLFSGDGSYRPDGRPELVLYGDKKKLLSLVETRDKMHGNGSYSTNLLEPSVYYDKTVDRVRVGLPVNIPTKFTVPTAVHSIQSRLLWFAGLLDSDGCVVGNGSSNGFQISSNKKEFLLDVMLMLQTVGVHSKVCDLYPEGMRLMPDGKGGSKEYFCKRTYRLLVGQTAINKLSTLGLKTNRLSWAVNKDAKDRSSYLKVVSIKAAENSDTYCFTEPLRNMGMLEGVLSMNCVESFSTTVPGKYHHVCSLVSLNAANLADSEVDKMARLAVNILDKALDMTVPPTQNAKAHLEAFRTIGIGVMGLHDYLARRGIMYQRSDREVSNLFEQIAYSSADESATLGEKRGSFGKFSTSTWAKGMMFSKPLSWYEDNASVVDVEDWKKLSWKTSKYMRFSQLTSPAPNTSSSLIQGCTSSVLPTFGKIFDDGNREGSITVCPPYIKDKMWYYTAAKDIEPMDIARVVVNSIQPWVCAGISLELLFDLNKDYVNAAYVYKVANYIWKNGGKAIYYIRWIKKNEESADGKVECESCAG